jgi:hypothetical protein
VTLSLAIGEIVFIALVMTLGVVFASRNPRARAAATGVLRPGRSLTRQLVLPVVLLAVGATALVGLLSWDRQRYRFRWFLRDVRPAQAELLGLVKALTSATRREDVLRAVEASDELCSTAHEEFVTVRLCATLREEGGDQYARLRFAPSGTLFHLRSGHQSAGTPIPGVPEEHCFVARGECEAIDAAYDFERTGFAALVMGLSAASIRADVARSVEGSDHLRWSPTEDGGAVCVRPGSVRGRWDACARLHFGPNGRLISVECGYLSSREAIPGVPAERCFATPGACAAVRSPEI